MSVSWHQKISKLQQLRRFWRKFPWAFVETAICTLCIPGYAGTFRLNLVQCGNQRVLNKQKDKHCKHAWCFEGSCKHSPISCKLLHNPFCRVVAHICENWCPAPCQCSLGKPAPLHRRKVTKPGRHKGLPAKGATFGAVRTSKFGKRRPWKGDTNLVQSNG